MMDTAMAYGTTTKPQSGSAVTLTPSRGTWPQTAPSGLVSSIIDRMIGFPVVIASPETTALDRAQQKSFMQALRRSVRVVA